MGWATFHIQKLANGSTVKFIHHGKRVASGRIQQGEEVTVEPIADISTLKINDIVLCQTSRYQLLQQIKGISGNQFLIGSVRSTGWTEKVYGKVVLPDHDMAAT